MASTSATAATAIGANVNTNALAALDAFVTLEADYNPEVYPLAKLLMRDRYSDNAARAAWETRMESRRQGARQLVLWLERDGVLNPK